MFAGAGRSPASASPTLQVVRHLAACGNGVLEGLEECDDGNTQPGDGCDATCKVCAGRPALAWDQRARPLEQGSACMYVGNMNSRAVQPCLGLNLHQPAQGRPSELRCATLNCRSSLAGTAPEPALPSVPTPASACQTSRQSLRAGLTPLPPATAAPLPMLAAAGGTAARGG